MAEFSGLFNSLNGDRKYNAERFAEYFASFLSDGIFNGGEFLRPYVNGGDLLIRVKPGKAWIKGYYYSLSDADKIIPLSNAHMTLPRIDRIVLRLDLSITGRNIQTVIKEGIPSSNPAIPALTRDFTGAGIFELSLGRVLVPASATGINPANVTDERLNASVCGLVNSLIQADTTNIFIQFQTYYNSVKTSFDADIADYRAEILSIINLFNVWLNDSQNEWGIQKVEWRAWFNFVKNDLNCAQVFDFDNLIRLPNTNTITTFNANGSITEVIQVLPGLGVFATRTTSFPGDGSIIIIVTCPSLGVNSRVTNIFNANGSINIISEVL